MRRAEQAEICPASLRLSPRTAAGLFLLAVCVAALIWVAFQGEDTNWDRRNYHFYTGYALLEGRFNRDVGVADLQTYLNPYVNAVTYLATSKLPFPLGAWLIAALQLLSVPLLFAISLRVIGTSREGIDYLLAVLAMSFGLLSPSWLSELGTTFFSSTTSPLILASVLLCFRFLQPESLRSGGLLILFASGLLLGLAVGLKLTNAPYAIAAAVALVASLSLARAEFQIQVRALAVLAAGGIVGALPALPWHIWLVDEFRNPVFPLYNALFKSQHFDLVNFRDMRWRFESIPDFLSFVFESTRRVARTGEIPFADARWAILAVLALAVVVAVTLARLPAAEPRRDEKDAFLPRVFLIVFVVVGAAIWATLFAYQRYLIPAELLFGPLAVVLSLWLVKGKVASAAVLAVAIAVTIAAIEVPDWGHAKHSLKDSSGSEPFNLTIPDRLRLTPARYLIFGLPNSFLVPFLHKDSIVSRWDISAGFRRDKFAEVTSARFAEFNKLPLRLIGNPDAVHANRADALRALGYDPNASLACAHFRSVVGSYVACELNGGDPLIGGVAGEPREARFEGEELLPNWLIHATGLSYSEPWGRWSEGERVTFYLAGCLPKGKIALELTGHAYGPNVGSAIVVEAGSSREPVKFGELTSVQTLRISIEDRCVDRLSLIVPFPTSPLQVGQSSDSRRLGIGISRLRLLISP